MGMRPPVNREARPTYDDKPDSSCEDAPPPPPPSGAVVAKATGGVLEAASKLSSDSLKLGPAFDRSASAAVARKATLTTDIAAAAVRVAVAADKLNRLITVMRLFGINRERTLHLFNVVWPTVMKLGADSPQYC